VIASALCRGFFVLSEPRLRAELWGMRVLWENYDLKKAQEAVKPFSEATVTAAGFNLAQLDLVDRGILLNSLKASPRSKQGFLDRIQINYAFYGKFFETGAQNAFGKGVEIPKTAWRSSAIEQNMQLLNDGMAEFYAELIVENLPIDEPEKIFL
jgi:hypothetical protein